MKKIIIIGIITILLLLTTFGQGAEEGSNSKPVQEIPDMDFIEGYGNLSFVTFETDEACEGYTLINKIGNIDGSAKLIDMNGKKVNSWTGFFPSVVSFPAKMLSNGDIIVGKTPTLIPWIIFLLFGEDAGHAFAYNQYVIQMDWNGTEKWSFNNWDEIMFYGINIGMAARQHHDFQRDGNPVGYYAPGQDFVTNGNTLILAKKDLINSSISNTELHDDVIYEVDWNGEFTGFIWYGNEHFEEFGFDESAKASISSFPGLDLPTVDWCEDVELQEFSEGDYLHINSISRLGINKWYNEDPELYSYFHPENIILDSRHGNFIAIIDHLTGNVVWRVGPDYSENTLEGQNIGQIIGPHNAHMIPNGLPGEGNILLFDNGGAAGYGDVAGQPNKFRNYSRIIEFNPVTLEIVWEYSNAKSEYADETFRHYWKTVTKGENHHFFSPYVSSAQRLINGNTLITEGFASRVFEVNSNGNLVWEYAPANYLEKLLTPIFYRAYRVPPEWVSENIENYDLWENIYQNVNSAPYQNTQSTTTEELLENQESHSNSNSSPINYR